jgi:transposase-like protein
MGKRSIEKERHWREIVARYERSGMKVRAFCDRHGIKEPQFFAWRRELRRRDAADPANPNDRGGGGGNGLTRAVAARDARTTKAAARTAPPAPFAPVQVVSTPSVPPSSIEIIVADGRRVAVGPGFDPEALRQVLAVVEGPAC